MGNTCSVERDILKQQEVYDFRFQGDPNAKALKVNDQIVYQKKLPQYTVHLMHLEKDPYEDKYSQSGDSVLLMGNNHKPKT